MEKDVWKGCMERMYGKVVWKGCVDRLQGKKVWIGCMGRMEMMYGMLYGKD